MGALEIVLILIGVVLLFGSFFIPEKLSKKELDKIAELSETEINHIVQARLSSVKSQIENDLDDTLEESYEKMLRQMEKDSNEKIMNINEYSDSVLDSISKTHNEVMFLYSMLNDKYEEMTNFANSLNLLKSEVMTLQDTMIQQTEIAQKTESEPIRNDEEIKAFTEEIFEDEKEMQKVHNEKIMKLHLEGKDVVEIARELSVGIGVVKLVLELNKGE